MESYKHSSVSKVIYFTWISPTRSQTSSCAGIEIIGHNTDAHLLSFLCSSVRSLLETVFFDDVAVSAIPVSAACTRICDGGKGFRGKA